MKILGEMADKIIEAERGGYRVTGFKFKLEQILPLSDELARPFSDVFDAISSGSARIFGRRATLAANANDK